MRVYTYLIKSFKKLNFVFIKMIVLCQLGSSVMNGENTYNALNGGGTFNALNVGGTYNIVCSGNGQCMTLRQIAQYTDYITYTNITTYTDWDADRISGCVCDPGYEGVSCAKKSCPKGDNPSTIGSFI